MIAISTKNKTTIVVVDRLTRLCPSSSGRGAREGRVGENENHLCTEHIHVGFKFKMLI